jgi:hypothetical protein
MACAYGNFFIIEKQTCKTAIIVFVQEKIPVVNDYRLSTNISECWHPPELL